MACMVRRLAIAVIVLAVSAVLSAQTLEDTIRRNLRGQLLTLKRPTLGRNLEFTSDGTPISGTRGIAGADDSFRVDDILWAGTYIVIKGHRAVRMYVDPKPGEAGPSFGVLDQPVQVAITFAKQPSDFPEFMKIMAQVFAEQRPSAQPACPREEFENWKASLAADPRPGADITGESKLGCLPTGASGWIANGKSVQPQAMESPDPVGLWRRGMKEMGAMFAVRVSEQGAITDIVVTKASDDQWVAASIDALRRWKFKPAEKDGKPVPVLIRVGMELTL